MSKKRQPDLHEQALRLFREIKRTDKQERAWLIVNEYNALVKDQKVNLKPVLEKMQAAFERGEVIGENTSLKSWCKVYKYEGVLSYARCRQIITGKTGHENRAVKPLDLKDGAAVSLGGKQFTIVIAPESADDLQKTKIPGQFRLALIVTPVEKPAPKAAAKSQENPWAPFRSKAAWTRNQHEGDQVEEYMKKERKTVTVVKQVAKKERKVHAVDPQKKELTRCMKSVSEYPTAEGDAVTCGLCQSSRDASDRWEAYLQEHPEERGWHAYRDEYSWRNKLDGRFMEKTKRKKEYTVSDEHGVIGVADDYNKACALKRGEQAAKALTAAVDGADGWNRDRTVTVVCETPERKVSHIDVNVADSKIPQRVRDTVEHQKSRIALGLHPVSGACPTDSMEEV